ncbi:MAG TPA: AAA family ATPase [Polyangiaceae bacterium]|jgi:tetratricopeptide (TPR) repeat protein
MDFRGTSRFRIERQIGSGGMGVVYEAFDTERGAAVALKTLRDKGGASLLRFKAEFRALADIHHENLVRFGELLEHEGRYFFTMELVRGGDFLSFVRPGIETESLASTEADLAGETQAALSNPRGSVAPSARPGKLDEARLRAALAQLARGLAALHAAGKVHRDVKPTNVLVEGEPDAPRVVIVDFGLVTDGDASQLAGEAIAGTIAYMAPEQAEGAVGPAADWYAVGAMLYEALTGQVPFFGSAYEVLTTKRTAEPPRPRAIAPDAPEDLDALCTDLLKASPDARPKEEEILARLGVSPARASLMPPSGESGAPFVGRRRELEQLQRAYEQARRGTCVTVYVHGESGLGKTALARHFVARMVHGDPSVVVLTGRCYERESVPYKAVDGVIDALGRWLLRVPRSELAGILPAATAARLGRAFPVLERLAPRGDTAPSSALDPLERRARVFHAMRELLHALAAGHLVVMLIDDLQWADADSLLLLREVMRSPPASILLVATVRTEREDARVQSGPPASLPASRLNVGSSTMPGDVRIVHLDPLGEAESRALAETLIERAHGGGPSSATESAASSIAREAAGHPLFIDELVRHAWIEEGLPKRRMPTIRLEDALWSRIRAADDLERRLLEVLAVARGPLAYEVAAHACGLDRASALDEVVAKLRFERLVRTTRMSIAARGERESETAVETYHDRVRRAVLAHLETPEAEVHALIANALEGSGDADLEALAEHHRGAGDLDKAAGYAMRAADAALAQLAFDRAARLYEWTFAMRPDAATKPTLVSLASALASAGRGPAAAEAYLRAAKLETDADAALDLRRLAAHHLLTTGHTREGLAVMTDVMHALDLELAASPRSALFWLGAHRARLRIRGLGLARHDAKRRELARVDACFTASAGLAHADPIRGAELQSRGLLLALAAGEPSRVARALANEAAYVATAGDDARARWTALLDRAREVATQTRDPRLLAHIFAGEGVALHLAGYWVAARARCEDALRLLREHAPSSTWEIDAATLYSMRSLLQLGQLGALRAELPERLAFAEARGDRFVQNSLRSGELNLVWLAYGDVEGARREVASAEENADDGLGVPHLQTLIARARIDLYAGEPAQAERRFIEAWPAIERSRLLRIQSQRITVLGVRARVALASARKRKARSMIDEAAAFANELARTGAPWALADAAMLRGCVGRALGDATRAAVSFDQAARDYATCDMALHAAVARMRLAKIVGGDEGRATLGQSRDWMQSQGVEDPEAFAAVLAP